MYMRVDMKSIYSEFALSGSKNKSSMTDTSFFPLSKVSTRGVTLLPFHYMKGKKGLKFSPSTTVNTRDFEGVGSAPISPKNSGNQVTW